MDAMSTAGENENLFLDALTTIHHAQLAIADTVPRLKRERERMAAHTRSNQSSCPYVSSKTIVWLRKEKMMDFYFLMDGYKLGNFAVASASEVKSNSIFFISTQQSMGHIASLKRKHWYD